MNLLILGSKQNNYEEERVIIRNPPKKIRDFEHDADEETPLVLITLAKVCEYPSLMILLRKLPVRSEYDIDDQKKYILKNSTRNVLTQAAGTDSVSDALRHSLR